MELWKSTGTAAGTVLVQDINPGSVSSGPRYLTNVNGTLFFSANDGVHGGEPWVLGPLPAAALAPATAAALPADFAFRTPAFARATADSDQTTGVVASGGAAGHCRHRGRVPHPLAVMG